MSRGVYRIEITRTIYALCDDEAEAMLDAGQWERDDIGDADILAQRVFHARALTEDVLDSIIHGNHGGEITVREALAMYEGR